MRSRALILALILSAAAASALAAQSIKIIPFGGFSKDMRSQTSNRWNMGLTLGVNVFAQESEESWIGGRIAFHSWSIDGEGWMADVASGNALLSAEGRQTVFEIIPAYRYFFVRNQGGVSVGAQVGAGLIYVSGGDVTLRMTFNNGVSSGTDNATISRTSMTGWGAQIGLPVTLGGSLEVVPIYTLYVASGAAYHHIALNAGLALGR